ncbi:hypothetical protein SAMN02745148_01559 [Modicisalibacter ilicicola DSM 19980]|uniref:DNA polymerase V n=1 Tax=Modicisalibacter ilicicola DSM 19980 TaxID=1121942 RepID=A0A1M4Y2X6_9GAMM|nr:hypothetical protein [Halomonas ilicicola]SHE99926.1 hypothetical protein SAMN02745148_01559 [Halomonas ilicicola DSM 19980]
MRVNYVGPLVAGLGHPALEGYDTTCFGTSCYLVEVSEEAGVDGPLIEGDVLVVDEGRVPQHNDLAVAVVEGEQRLFNTVRIGNSLLLVPPLDKSGAVPARWSDLRGVVIRQARRYAF